MALQPCLTVQDDQQHYIRPLCKTALAFAVCRTARNCTPQPQAKALSIQNWTFSYAMALSAMALQLLSSAQDNVLHRS